MTTPTMIEQCARAMCIADGLDPDSDWRDTGAVFLTVAVQHPERWRKYVGKVRAVLETLKQPTDGMIEAMRKAVIEGRGIYTAGIDAAKNGA